MQRDREGHREYYISYLVKGTEDDGPATILQTTGLPTPGSIWAIGNDVDIWATCQLDAQVTIHDEVEGEPSYWWRVDQVFSTKGYNRCVEQQIEDPLLEPAKVSGSFIKERIEATENRFGKPIKNSAHEQIRGPQVEFDHSRAQIRIQINSALLGLELFGPMIDTLNRYPLWGLPPRCIKLSNVSWERRYYGTCFIYYTLMYEFDVNVKYDPTSGELVSGWDRDIMDEGTKVLNGHWGADSSEWILDNIGGETPDPENPKHFMKAVDRYNNPQHIVLNGAGLPAGISTWTDTLYISISDANTGNPLTDDNFWLELQGPYDPEEIPKWDESVDYTVGTIVDANISFDPSALRLFIALEDNSGINPLTDTFDNWQEIILPDFVGEYSDVTTYSEADVVGVTEEEAIGIIHVEKYNESDFLLLGIPIVLG